MLKEAQKDLLSVDNDGQFERIHGLTWFPWVGADYYSSNPRILIVAESHYNYGQNVNQANEVAIRERWTTRNVVQSFAISKRDANNNKLTNNMFENLHRSLLGTANFNRESVWKNIAFYNFVQRPLNYNGNEYQKERPTFTDLQNGWHVFSEIVNILRPTLCVFVGTTAIDNFAEYAIAQNIRNYSVTKEKPYDKAKRYAKKITFCKEELELKCIAIQHTSRYFSWSKWNKYLKEEVPEIIEFLITKSKIYQQ